MPPIEPYATTLVSSPEEVGPPAPMLAPELGPAYRVEHLLGSGGMGAVWLARWQQSDVERLVAVKVLLAGRESQIALRRFQRERRILARLQHPGIARFLDIGTTLDGRLFLTMEYIDGRLLIDHVRATRPDIAGRLKLLIEISEAVDFAHRSFVVHRDLKPQNVLVDADGHPHLLDFGIARLFGESEEETLTQTGIRPLSPGYAAPEQLRGDDVGTGADIYALGVIGYELLCGTRPFERQGGLEKILRDLGSERMRTPSQQVLTTLADETLLPPLSQKRLSRELQGDLDTILMRALAPNPQRRYPTAAELADDLERYLDGRPIRARPDSALYRMRKFVGRHRNIVAVASSAILALVVGLVVALSQAQRANAERDRALASRDFLLGMVQSANPYQAPNPAQRVDVMFERAAGELAGRFPNDPEIEAQLLQQFGRSLMILERFPAAAAALERAERLLADQVAPTHPVLVETRGRLTDLYRLRREFGRAAAISEQQFALCNTSSELSPMQCLVVRNDRIENTLFAGDTGNAEKQIADARAFATAQGLDDDYESVFIDYLAGITLRHQGRATESAESFLRLAERTLATVPAQHPGLLTDVLWFGWIALDLGDVELATACSEYALRGRVALYAPASRYVLEARLQRGVIAFAALDTTRARSEFEAVQAALPVADTATSGQRALAEAWSDIVADQPAPVRSSSLLPPIDDRSNVATELRLLQAVAALRRGDVVAASDLRAEIEHSGALATLAYWHAPVRLFDAHRAAHALDQTTADADRAGAIAILATQKRRHFDPIARQWVGAPSPAAEQIAARIHALAKRIGAAREQPF